MAELLVIRHGQASFGQDDYDVLSDLGHQQSRAVGALLREMATVSYHATCPHGRPVARKLGRGQVERMFGR